MNRITFHVPNQVYSIWLFIFFLYFGNAGVVEGKEVQNFISYEFSGGRFGDNLLAYLHAKWLSYRYQVPLLYKPFPYSSELVLDDHEIHYSEFDLQHLHPFILKSSDIPLPFSRRLPKLYICNYFPECQWERENTSGLNGKPWDYFDVDWKDPFFNELIQKLIAPKYPQLTVIPPKNTINIAIHLRNGGTYDTQEVFLHFITKFPPLNFYIEGLMKIIKLFPGKTFYCYLFTDADNPHLIIEEFRLKIPSEIPVIFDCRLQENAHNRNVLEDFFSLFQFDILIHPQSNFSLIPALVHNYAIEYAPLSGKLIEQKVHIDRMKFSINKELCQQLIKK